jgi:hypothetical protein
MHSTVLTLAGLFLLLHPGGIVLEELRKAAR